MVSTTSNPVQERLAPPPAMLFSRVVGEIPQALSIRFNQRVTDLKRQGRDVITLSLGESFFDLPLFSFSRVDYTKGYHYSDSRGIPELRSKIASYYRGRYGAQVDEETEVLVSSGSKVLLYLSMLTVLNPGDEVLVHEPCWLSYPEQVRLCGGTPTVIPYDIPASEFHRFVSPRTRMLILNNPNNPAGHLYPSKDLRDLYRMCCSKGIYLLVDEAYSDFVLDDSFVSLATIAPEKDHAIVVNSLSKNLGVSGWRIGYVISHPHVISQILKVQQHLITCAPTLLQYYCARYFDRILRLTLPQVKEVVRKRQRIAARMDELGLARLAGGTTFYFFVRIDPFPGTSLEFATQLLEEKAISVVPGSAYGENTDRFVRISIGAEPEERIVEALWVMKEFMASSRSRNAGR